MKKTKIILTTVYNNYQYHPQLKTGWGFSCLVNQSSEGKGGFNILFDTGADSEALLFNMKKMTLNPKNIDFVFISHLHEDHTCGLSGILEIKPNLRVYKPESFSGPSQIVDGVWTTGPLGREIVEQSLIISSEKGLVVITGCAHPGVVNIVKKIKKIFPQESIYLVLGGFHLGGALD
ncbi:MBL fold metallo-hydrolase, partial [Candidatus Roizmanbacteria bacterium CG23_combo_of_CG06-09_8_20_14_all_35_49]